MTSLIDYTYFTSGRLVITGLAGNDVINDSNIDEVEQFIAIYEKWALKRLFGTDLYAAFVTDMETVPVPSRWTPVIAMLLPDTTHKLSPLANLIYYGYIGDKQALLTAGQTVKVVAADSVTAGVPMLMTAIYNEAVDDLSDVYDYIAENSTLFPEWEGDAFAFAHINFLDI